MSFVFHATAPFELEGVVARELKELGAQKVRPESGAAVFEGSLQDAMRMNLWLRTADRVLLCMGRFRALTFDQLFEGVKSLPWELLFPKNAAFPVTGKCAKSQLMSVPDCQAITKKAIAERLKSHYRLTWMPEDGPLYRVDVHLHGDEAVLTVDTSGASLSKRGYRTYNGDAPVRETLAASILKLAHWYPDMPLCDPMCGTGTIAIEAAMMALNRAPGLQRRFDMEQWPCVDPSIAARLRSEAQDAFKKDAQPEIFASDISPKAVALTKKHIRLAGMDWKIKVSCCDFSEVSGLPQRGAFVVNPPYGVRLMDVRQAEALYARMAPWWKQYPYWSLNVLTAHKGFERVFGRRADSKRRIFNGKLECGLYIMRGKRRVNPNGSQAGGTPDQLDGEQHG